MGDLLRWGWEFSYYVFIFKLKILLVSFIKKSMFRKLQVLMLNKIKKLKTLG